MKILFLITLLIIFSSLGLTSEQYSAYLPNSELYIGTISDVKVVTRIANNLEDQDTITKKDIKNQLAFLLGHLSRYKSTAEIADIDVEILGYSSGERPLTLEVSYNASLLLHLSQNDFPKRFLDSGKFESVVPLFSNPKHIKEFNQEYNKSCSELGKKTESETFFYYYNPLKRRCKILSQKHRSNLIERITLALKKSGRTRDKTPQRSKEIWSDGIMKIAAVYSLDLEEMTIQKSTEKYDWGEFTYRKAINNFTKLFGQPTSSSIGEEKPSGEFPEITYYFDSERGPIEVSFFLVERYELKYPRRRFKKAFSEATYDADIVAYAGHAGYGENIVNIVKYATVKKDHHQTWLLLGCNSYSYLGGTVYDHISSANPNSPRYQYADVILTGWYYLFGNELAWPLPALAQNFASKTPRETSEILEELKIGRPIMTFR